MYGTQTDFPVYVDLSDLGSDFFSAVKSDGSDILVTDWSGDTILKREVVSIDTSAETGTLFFKAPVLYDYSDNDFYIYYQYASASLTNDVEVWDDDFVLSQHLEETTTPYEDSTQYSNDGISTTGIVSRASAQIGYGQSFNSGSAIEIDSDVSLQLAQDMTFYGWVRFNDVSGNQTFINKGLHSSNLNYSFGMYSIGSNLRFSYYDGEIQNILEDSNWTPTVGTLYHIAIVVNKSENTVKFLVDGEEKSTVVDSNSLNYSNTSTDDFIMGANSNYSDGMDGILDEITLSKTGRSTNWIKTTYYNQNDSSNFYAVGSEEDRPNSSSSSSSSSFSSSCSCSSSFSSSSSSSSYYLEALNTLYTDNSIDYDQVSTDGTYIYTIGDGTLKAHSFDGSTLTEIDSIAANFGTDDDGINIISDGNYIYLRNTYDMQSSFAGTWYPTRVYAFSFDGTTLTLLQSLTIDEDDYLGTDIYAEINSFAIYEGRFVVGIKTGAYDTFNYYIKTYSFDGTSFTLEDTNRDLYSEITLISGANNSRLYCYSDPYLVTINIFPDNTIDVTRNNIGSLGNYLNSKNFASYGDRIYLTEYDSNVIQVYEWQEYNTIFIADTSDLVESEALTVPNPTLVAHDNQFFMGDYTLIGYELKNDSVTQKYSKSPGILQSAVLDDNYIYAINSGVISVLGYSQMNVGNANLQLIDTYDTLETSEEVQTVYASYPYVFTAGSDKLRFFSFDGSTLTHIQDLNWSNPVYGIPELWSDGTYLYAAGSGVYAYEIDPEGLTLVGSYNTDDDYLGIWGDGNYVYSSKYSPGSIEALSLNTSEETFNLVGSSSVSNIGSIWGDGTYIYFARGIDGFSAYIFDGTNFTEVATENPTLFCRDIWSDGTYVYVNGYNNSYTGIYSYTFNGSTFTFANAYQTGNACYGVYGGSKFNGGYGFTYSVENEGGLRAYLIGANSTMAIVDEDYQGGNYYGVFADTQYSGFGYIYVASGDSGLHVYKLDAEVISSSSSSYSSSSSSSNATFSSSSSSSSSSYSSSCSCSSSSSSYSSSSSSFSSCSSSSDAAFSSCSCSSSSSSDSVFSSSSSSFSSSSFSSSSSSSANAIGADWYDGNWAYRQRITVDDTQILGSHNDFTVYLNLSDLGSTFFSNARSDGSDIVITNKGGSAKLPRELTAIDTSEETGSLFFRAFNLDSDNRDFYVYYGYAGASEVNDINTWGEDYVGVWHLEDYEEYADSSQYENDGSGTSTRIPTPMSYGQMFFENDRITIPNSDSLEIASGLSFSAYFRREDDDDQDTIVILTSDFTDYNYSFILYSREHKLAFLYKDKDTSNEILVQDTSAWTPEIDKWYYLSVIVDKGSELVTFMVDGYIRSTVRNVLNYTTYSDCEPIIGITNSDITGPLQSLDEVFLSKSPRSTDWYQTLYNNLGSSSTFYSVGSEESGSSPSSSSSSSSSS